MNIEQGDVVLLKHKPAGRIPWWDKCLLTVEEVRAWGVIGFVMLAQGEAPLRVSNEDIAAVYRKLREE